MAKFANLISQSDIRARFGSSLCQFQTFLIQWRVEVPGAIQL